MNSLEIGSPLVNRLGSGAEIVREEALRELNAMPPLEACQALKDFGKGQDGLLFSGCLMGGVGGGSILISIAIMVLILLALLDPDHLGFQSFTQLLLVFAVPTLTACISRGFLAQRQQVIDRTVDTLSASTNRGVIEALLRSRDFTRGTYRANAEQALIRFLPELERGDAILLSSDILLLLDHFIDSENLMLARATLSALGSIGDARSLEACRSLLWRAQPGTTDLFPVDPSLRGPASQTIEAIERRLQLEEVRKTLLRSSGNPTGNELLLRYPAAQDLQAKSQLLRVGDENPQ